MDETIGEFHHKTVEMINNGLLPLDNDLVRETAVRLIEEVVELALEASVSPGRVFEAVADALHNESRKTTKHLYPSQLGFPLPNRQNMLVEIVDVGICLDYLRYVARITTNACEEHLKTKLELVRLRARDGVYRMVGKRIYKKESRS